MAHKMHHIISPPSLFTVFNPMTWRWWLLYTKYQVWKYWFPIIHKQITRKILLQNQRWNRFREVAQHYLLDHCVTSMSALCFQADV